MYLHFGTHNHLRVDTAEVGHRLVEHPHHPLVELVAQVPEVGGEGRGCERRGTERRQWEDQGRQLARASVVTAALSPCLTSELKPTHDMGVETSRGRKGGGVE